MLYFFPGDVFANDGCFLLGLGTSCGRPQGGCLKQCFKVPRQGLGSAARSRPLSKKEQTKLAGARDAGNEKWNDLEINHPIGGFVYSGILRFIPLLIPC